MAKDVNNIKIGVNLIDDYLLLQEAPVANGLTRDLFTVVQNPLEKSSASELLTLDGDGDPVHFYPDSSSQSGWSTVKLGATKPDDSKPWNRIVAFYQQGLLNALCYYPLDDDSGKSCAVWMQSATPGTWTTASLSPDATNYLGCTYQTDRYVDSDGNAYLYGFTANMSPPTFFIMAFMPGIAEDGKPTTWWNHFFEYWPSQFSPAITDVATASFRLAPGPDGAGSVTLVWVDDNKIAYQDGTITWSDTNGEKTPSFQLTGSANTYDPNAGTLTAKNLYAVPGELGSGNLLLLDSASKLHLVSGLHGESASMTPLTGGTGQPGSASAVGVGVDSSNVVTIFAIEPGSGNLWYLQQTSTTALTFGSWVQLGGTLYSLNCPPYMRAGPELFYAGLGTDPQSGSTGPAAFHMGQNISDGGDGTYIWAANKVSAPPSASNTTPVQTATYSMEVQALDSAGNPVAGGTLTVTADQSVTVIWNSEAFHIGPNTPLKVSTDGAGQATALFEGVDLKPAVITFSAYDTNNKVTASRWCRGDVVQYIADLDGTQLTPLSNSVAPQLASVTGSDLMTNGLVGGDYDSTTQANTAATAINNCGQYMQSQTTTSVSQGTLDTSKFSTPHWQIDFTHPNGPRYRVLTEDEAEAFLAKLPQADDPVTPGSSLGSSIGKTFGDAAHFFKHEFDQLNSFTATLKDGVLKIVFNDIPAFTIATIKQAGAGLETIFAKIKQVADDVYKVVKEVIAWLKMLFDWSDILNTHDALKAVISSMLNNLEASATNAAADLSSWFSPLIKEINNVFDDLSSDFDSSTSFNDLANQAQTAAPALLSSSSNVLAATDTANAQQQHASKCNYIYSRARPSFSAIGTAAFTVSSTAASSDPTQAIIDAVNDNILNGDTFDQASQSFLNKIYANAASPQEFFDMIVLTFLEAAKELTLFVVSVIEAVLEAILNLLEDALKALQTTLTTKAPTIPVVTWLWENVISDDELTLLDLFCLIVAVPTTILYKIVFGGSDASAPFTSDMVSELQSQGLPWPAVPLLSETSLAAPAPEAYTPPSAATLEALAMTAGLSLFLNGFLAADTDFYAANDMQQEAGALSIALVVLSAYQNGATAPYTLFAKEKSERSDADIWMLRKWYTGLAQFGCDAAFVALSSSHTLTKFVDTAGPAADTAAGLLQEAFGVVACTYMNGSAEYTDWDIAGNVIGPIASCLRFLIACGDDAVVFLQGTDIVVATGTMVTVCGVAKNG